MLISVTIETRSFVRRHSVVHGAGFRPAKVDNSTARLIIELNESDSPNTDSGEKR